MNPTIRLRCAYALMIAFVAVVMVHMGMLITYQIQNGVVQGPVLNYALIDIVIAYTLGQIIWRSTRQLVLSQKWLRHFRANRHDKLTKRLNYKYRDWGTEIIVVQDDAFVALTMGLLRPKIVVSTTVLEMFTDKEIKAILLHERYHCRNYDGLKMFFQPWWRTPLDICRSLNRFFATIRRGKSCLLTATPSGRWVRSCI